MGPLFLAIPALVGALHDDSASFSRLEVGADEVAVVLRVQALSVLEVMPWMDVDGDQLLSPAEAAARPGELGSYVLEHYRLRAGDRDLRPEAYPALRQDPAAALPGSWIEARWRIATAGPVRDLELDVDLFVEGSPGHLEFTEVSWRGTALPPFTIGPGGGSWAFVEPTAGASAVAALRELDGRLFLWALVVLAGALACARADRPATLLIALLAVCLGVLWVRLGGPLPPRRPLELAAVLGAAYVAADLALFERTRPPWLEAAVFGGLIGLAHGAEASARLVGEVRGGVRLAVEVGAGAALAAVVVALMALTVRGRARRPAAGILALVGLGLFVASAF